MKGPCNPTGNRNLGSPHSEAPVAFGHLGATFDALSGKWLVSAISFSSLIPVPPTISVCRGFLFARHDLGRLARRARSQDAVLKHKDAIGAAHETRPVGDDDARDREARHKVRDLLFVWLRRDWPCPRRESAPSGCGKARASKTRWRCPPEGIEPGRALR